MGGFKASFWYVILVLICLGLGSFLCIRAWVTSANIRASLQQRPVTSQGRIISCKMESVHYWTYPAGDHWVDECRPTVRFQTPFGHQTDVVSSYPWGGFHPGDNVSVHYQPDRPQDAMIVSNGLWSDVELDGFFGLLLIALSVIIPITLWISSLRRKRSRGKLPHREKA